MTKMQQLADEITLLRLERDDARKEVKRLCDILFVRGEMLHPPCFRCGYNGPEYFQPNVHRCAKRHHELYKYPQYENDCDIG